MVLLDIDLVSPTNCHRSDDMGTKILDTDENRGKCMKRKWWQKKN